MASTFVLLPSYSLVAGAAIGQDQFCILSKSDEKMLEEG